MKTGVFALFLCLFFFIVPLQCYIIGDNWGMGIQGAVYRYQIAQQGNSLIPLTNEIGYVTSGTYEGRTAYSVVSWVLGTMLLMIVTIYSLIHSGDLTSRHIRIITIGVVGAGIGYLLSCIFQYGYFFSGAAGVSLPVGVIAMIFITLGMYGYRDYFLEGTRDVS